MSQSHQMLEMPQVEQSLAGLGFERVHTIHGSSYKDTSTVILCPTRGTIHHRVVSAWQSMAAPMNQKRAFMFCAGDEVGRAYDGMIEAILAHSELSKWKYVMTVEDDNIVPPDAHIRLLESIEASGGLDAVGGIYFTKGDLNMPMAYGDPEEFRRTGKLDFRPRDLRSAIPGNMLVEVNGIAMGCSLYRMDLFRQLPKPWFVTVSDWDPKVGTACYTQDLSFCEKAKRAGKRFAVDCRVKVGHMDVSTGVVY